MHLGCEILTPGCCKVIHTDTVYIGSPQLLQLIGGLFAAHHIDQLGAALFRQGNELLAQHTATHV